MSNIFRSRIVWNFMAVLIACGALATGTARAQGLLYSYETPDDVGTPAVNE